MQPRAPAGAHESLRYLRIGLDIALLSLRQLVQTIVVVKFQFLRCIQSGSKLFEAPSR